MGDPEYDRPTERYSLFRGIISDGTEAGPGFNWKTFPDIPPALEGGGGITGKG